MIFSLAIAALLVIAYYLIKESPNPRSLLNTKEATVNETMLYEELASRNIDVTLHFNDGFKTVDLAILSADLYLEVDGEQHCYKTKQARSDLTRTKHDLLKGIVTIRIPNVLVQNELEYTADMIEEIVEDRVR